MGSLRRLLSEPRVLATIGLTRGLAEEEREQALREMSEAQSASDSASESDSDPSGPKAGPESDADACATPATAASLQLMTADTGCVFCAQLRDAAGGGGAAGRRGRARIGNRRRLALDRHVRALPN